MTVECVPAHPAPWLTSCGQTVRLRAGVEGVYLMSFPAASRVPGCQGFSTPRLGAERSGWPLCDGSGFVPSFTVDKSQNPEPRSTSSKLSLGQVDSAHIQVKTRPNPRTRRRYDDEGMSEAKLRFLLAPALEKQQKARRERTQHGKPLHDTTGHDTRRDNKT